LTDGRRLESVRPHHLRGDALVGLRLIPLLALAVVSTACTSEPSTREPTSAVRITGDVLEQLDAPPYSFLRLRTDKGDVWTAVPIVAAPPGKKVTVANGVTLKRYEARSIGRRFDAVVFGTLARD
jgi:hypothetical protein